MVSTASETMVFPADFLSAESHEETATTIDQTAQIQIYGPSDRRILYEKRASIYDCRDRLGQPKK